MADATQPAPYRSVFRPGLFEGRVVIVTGAGSGFGRCCAHELAALGARVALLGRNVEKLDAVAAELEPTGAHFSTHSVDIRDEAAVEATVAAVLAAHGRIDGLFNNAGGQYPSPLEDISLRGWEAVIRTNLTGTFLMSRAVYRSWMKANGGAIVNMIADIWHGMPTMGHSGAARAGTLNFTETAACEWAASGVRVNAVAPGWIASSGFDTYDPPMQAELRRLKSAVPLQRYGTVAELSAATVFLLSEAAAFITGTCIRIDGGVPNARHTWPTRARDHETDATRPFYAFPLERPPRMLDQD